MEAIEFINEYVVHITAIAVLAVSVKCLHLFAKYYTDPKLDLKVELIKTIKVGILIVSIPQFIAFIRKFY